MKVSATYEIRGETQTKSWSAPQPTIHDLTRIILGLAWVAGQNNPKVTVDESTL
jgi:hypothetical protein